MKKRNFAATAAALAAATGAHAQGTFKSVTGVGWELKGHESSSEGKRRDAALRACEAKISHDIASTRVILEGVGDVSYRSVTLDRMYDGWSNTKGHWSGVRKHKAGGKADCTYYREVSIHSS